MLYYRILFAFRSQWWQTGALVLTGARISVSLALLLAFMMRFAIQPFQCMVLSGDGFFCNTFPPLPFPHRGE